jgi:hypothetical protein
MTDTKVEVNSMPDRLRAAAEELPDDSRLRDLLEEAADDIEVGDQAFDMRWKADMRAIERWQKAHPGKELTWPDHADLVTWLLEQLEARG